MDIVFIFLAYVLSILWRPVNWIVKISSSQNVLYKDINGISLKPIINPSKILVKQLIFPIKFWEWYEAKGLIIFKKNANSLITKYTQLVVFLVGI